MALKMGSISKAMATGQVLKREHTDDKKIRIRYCRGDDGLDGRKKRELDEEAKHVCRKVKDVTMRMDEEDIVKEKVRCKQREDEENRRVNTDSKRLSEMTRAEKNKAWRMRQEEQMMNNWREVDHRVREELCCPCCAEEMTPPSRIYQCRDGHVVCQQCFQHKHIEVCPSCKHPISGRNIAMEKIASIYFHGQAGGIETENSIRSSTTSQ